MRKLLFALGLVVTVVPSFSQQKVTFFAEDSLKLFAHLYLSDHRKPFILLFHQGESSKGEYTDIAPRLLKLDYNCLAVDLRTGGKMNYVENETVSHARDGNFERSMLAAANDIKAAVDFVAKYNDKPPVLMGSSFSASLCLLEAAGNRNIKAVVAMSPGEFFRPALIVKENVSAITQPVFVSATALEAEFVRLMLADIPEAQIHFFEPGTERGGHGAKMLWNEGEYADRCWLELLLFFKKIRY